MTGSFANSADAVFDLYADDVVDLRDRDDQWWATRIDEAVLVLVEAIQDCQRLTAELDDAGRSHLLAGIEDLMARVELKAQAPARTPA